MRNVSEAERLFRGVNGEHFELRIKVVQECAAIRRNLRVEGEEEGVYHAQMLDEPTGLLWAFVGLEGEGNGEKVKKNRNFVGEAERRDWADFAFKKWDFGVPAQAGGGTVEFRVADSAVAGDLDLM